MPVNPRRELRPRKADGPKNIRWRPSKRNDVIRNALMPGPLTVKGRVSGELCPCCAEGNLRPQTEVPNRGTRFSLAYLGIKVYRWYRHRMSMYCDVCGTSFANHEWNIVKSSRKWADFGCTKFPVPRRRRRRRHDKSLKDILIAQLHPRKRCLVNLKFGRGLVRRERRLARLVRWSFIKRGVAPPSDEW